MFFFLWPFLLLQSIARLIGLSIFFLTAYCTVAAYIALPGPDWLMSLSSHFVLQYFCIQSLALLIQLIDLVGGKKDFVVVCAYRAICMLLTIALIFANGFRLLPFYQTAAAHIRNAPIAITSMHLNVFAGRNEQYVDVARLIQNESPDLVDFVEYNQRWREALEQKVLYRYHYRSFLPGLALYSKFPLHDKHPLFPGKSYFLNQMSLLTHIRVSGTPVSIIVAHPASPIRPDHLSWQRHIFSNWIQNRSLYGKNLMLIGDLNTSPWSSDFNWLTHGMALQDAALGFGVQPTWPARIVALHWEQGPLPGLPFLGIPIDHALVSPKIQVLDYRVGPYVGSDHLPVIVRWRLKL